MLAIKMVKYRPITTVNAMVTSRSAMYLATRTAVLSDLVLFVMVGREGSNVVSAISYFLL
jgi:hypothetical protein